MIYIRQLATTTFELPDLIVLPREILSQGAWRPNEIDQTITRAVPQGQAYGSRLEVSFRTCTHSNL